MALESVITYLVLDVIDHDQTQGVVKAIALDSKTRFVKATLVQHGIDYPVDENATVTLTILRPDNVGVQVTGSVVDVDNADRTGTIKGVYAELTQAALAKSGTLRAQFKMTVGEQILRTEIFQVKNGVALDGETDTWADQYQGYNLDEVVQTVNASSAAVTAMQTTVNGLQGDLEQLQIGVIACESGAYLDSDGVTKTANATRIRNSNPIAVTGFNAIIIPDGYSAWIYRLDANRTLISPFGTLAIGEIAFSTLLTDETKYLNIGIRNTTTPSSDISSQVDTVANGLKLVSEVDSQLNALNSGLSDINGRFETVCGKNLYNVNDSGNAFGVSNNNCYTLSAQGDVYNSTGLDGIYSVSHFIPVEEGKTVYFSSDNRRTTVYQICQYDANKAHIGTRQTYIGEFTVPTGCKFIRVSSTRLTTTFQAEYDARTAYETYTQTTYLDNVKVHIEDVVGSGIDRLVIPAKMYGVQNKEYNLFYKNVIVGNAHSYIVGRTGSGEGLSRRVRYNLANAGESNTVISLYDSSYNLMQTKTIKYVNADASAHSGETLKVLVIGDSFINSGYVTSGLINDFDGDAAALELLGTLGSAPNKHEGRSGWSSYEYTHEASVSGVSNAFLYNGAFDFAHYISANNISTPDYVIIHLGINDGWKPMHDTTTAENLQTMIDSIHEYNSSIKVIVGTTPSPYLGDAENGYDLELLTNRKRQMLTKDVLDNITESGTVIICPVHLNFDTDYSFNMSTTTKNGHDSGTVPYCSDDTHPSASGFYQVADSYYACIKAN